MMKELKEKIDAVIDIKCEALYLHEQILSGPTEAYGEIEKKFEELVDRFYEDNGEAIKERQYKTARNNYEYFMVLIEQLLNTYREQTLKDKQESRERK
jgi:hypothetical protein